MVSAGNSLSDGLATQELEVELHHLRGEYVRLLKTTEELRKNLTALRAQVTDLALDHCSSALVAAFWQSSPMIRNQAL
jgi:ribosomal protein L29